MMRTALQSIRMAVIATGDSAPIIVTGFRQTASWELSAEAQVIGDVLEVYVDPTPAPDLELEPEAAPWTDFNPHIPINWRHRVPVQPPRPRGVRMTRSGLRR